jgi:hypothetical protein
MWQAGRDLEAAENPAWYTHWEHLSLVSALDSDYVKAAGICTLGVYNIDAIAEASADGYVDSTRDEYLTGVNTFVFCMDIDSVKGDTIQVDSLWWDIHSTTGLGPLRCADTSSVVIGVNIIEDTFYGPFPKQKYSDKGAMYPLRVPRGQGILYIMANWTAADTGVVWSELWKARR